MAALDRSAASPIREATSSADIVRYAEECRADAILFDIGGVLADDFWETLLLDERSGLAARRRLDREAVAAEGRALWAWASREPIAESAYWSALEERLGIEISGEEIAALESSVRGNPEAAGLRSALDERGLRIGLLTNNSAFWWQKQLRLAGIPEVGESELRFLSFEHGVSKSDRPGLIELAATAVPAARTVVVDDRSGNLQRAADLGFEAIRYDFRKRVGA